VARSESAIAKRRKATLKLSRPDYVEKRAQILSAATRIFAEQGYRETSISDIAREVDLDRATFYYYVGSKTDLFDAIAVDAAEENVTEVERICSSDDPADKKLASLVEQLMSSYERNYPRLFIFIREYERQLEGGGSHSKRLKEIQKRYDTALSGIIREGQEAGLFNKDLPVREIGFSIIGMINWSHLWFKPGRSISGSDMGKAMSTLVMDGIRAKRKR